MQQEEAFMFDSNMQISATNEWTTFICHRWIPDSNLRPTTVSNIKRGELVAMLHQAMQEELIHAGHVEYYLPIAEGAQALIDTSNCTAQHSLHHVVSRFAAGLSIIHCQMVWFTRTSSWDVTLTGLTLWALHHREYSWATASTEKVGCLMFLQEKRTPMNQAIK